MDNKATATATEIKHQTTLARASYGMVSALFEMAGNELWPLFVQILRLAQNTS